MTDPRTDTHAWIVPAAAEGERLDRFLTSMLEAPRNQVQHWIRDGRVEHAGRTARKPSQPLVTGDAVRCTPPPPATEDPRIEPEAGDLHVLYEDEHLLALDKPPGLTVHPGAGRDTGTLVHRLLRRYPELAGVGGTGRPGIVHRLDKDTSGVLVVARTAESYQALMRAFAERRVRKQYLAIVYGVPREAAGRIEAPIGRHRHKRKEMTVRGDGRPALTDYRTLASSTETGAGLALLEVDLHTGRTHQIRVHLKHLGHPLVGDPVYGEARWRGLLGPSGQKQARFACRDFPRPALHAWRLGLDHPVTGKPVQVEAPVPDDLRQLWQQAAGQAWPTT